jgi:hypothetical protein
MKTQKRPELLEMGRPNATVLDGDMHYAVHGTYKHFSGLSQREDARNG